MRPSDNPTFVRFVQPISLGPKQGVKYLNETEGGEWDMSLEGSFIRIEAKVHGDPTAKQKSHEMHTTYVPLTNVEFIRCEPTKHLGPIELPESSAALTDAVKVGAQSEAQGPQPEEPKGIGKLFKGKTKK